jgi:rubrerythrin
VFASAAAACAADADAEVANIAQYNELLATTRPADVRRVFGDSRRASLQHHLSAFRRCGPNGTS